MNKESFLASLNEEQKKFVGFLLDTAYANGYSAGQLNVC